MVLKYTITEEGYSPRSLNENLLLYKDSIENTGLQDSYINEDHGLFQFFYEP